MYIKFENGAEFALIGYPKSADAVLAGHKRDVLTVTVGGEHSAVKSAFNGQGWSIVDGKAEYDKSGYTLVASICDNMDGTITVRIGRANTVEESLRDLNAELLSAFAEQADIINILSGGAF